MLNLYAQRKLMRRYRARTEVKADYTQGALGGNETITRSAGGVYVHDHEGVLRLARDNEMPFVKLRRVDNVLQSMGVAKSYDLTSSGWATGADAETTLDASVLTPFGRPANKVTFNANTAVAHVITPNLTFTGSGRKWCVRVLAKEGTPSKQVSFVIQNQAGTSLAGFIEPVLTSQWKWYYVASSSLSADTAMRFRFTRVNWTASYFIYVGDVQVEEITGASIQFPNEYVSVGELTAPYHGVGVDGVKYFATTNGNSGASGVLIDAAGTALTSGAALIEGQATNLIAAANYRDFSTWSFDTTDATVAVNQVGINGTSNVACLLTDASGTGYSNKQLSLSVGNDSVGYIISFYIKKDADTSRFPAIRTSFTGGTAVHQQSMVNTSTGAITTYSVSNGSHIVDDVGNWWRVTQFLANNSTGNTTLRINLYPAAGTVFGTAATAAQGTAIFDWGTVCTNQVFQSPIQGAATRYESFISRPWIGATNNFWVYVDLKANFNYNMANASGFMRFCSIFSSSNNLLNTYLQLATGKVAIAHTIDGSTTTSAQSAAMLFNRGDRLRLLLTMDSTNGVRVRVNFSGTAYTDSLTGAASKAGISALSSGANFYLCNYDNTLDRTLNSEVAAYRLGTGILNTAQMADIVGA